MVVELLNRGTHPQSLWDAYFQAAAEMLMRKPGIVSLHAGTTTNALHYAWKNCHNDRTRRFLMLQNASFLTLFRQASGANEGVLVDAFEAAAAGAPLDPLLAEIDQDKMKAAQQSLAWLQAGGDAKSFIAAAQRLIYLKGTDSHDYKFSSAVFEDYRHLSPDVRDRFLAASVFWLSRRKAKSTGERRRTPVAPKASFGHHRSVTPIRTQRPKLPSFRHPRLRPCRCPSPAHSSLLARQFGFSYGYHHCLTPAMNTRQPDFESETQDVHHADATLVCLPVWPVLSRSTRSSRSREKSSRSARLALLAWPRDEWHLSRKGSPRFVES